MNTDQPENIRASPLARHLAIILSVKVLLLVLLWWLFFRLPDGGASARVDVQTHIAGPASQITSQFTGAKRF
jgi:hypothetical protein